MSDIIRHMPFDVPEPVRRFLQGDIGSWLRVEEYHDGSTLVIRAEVPGVDPEKDVDITVAGTMLTIEARREEQSEHQDRHNYRSEFRYGAFSRSFQLPSGVKEDDIQASYNSGVLEVRVPSPGQGTTPGRKVPVNRTDSWVATAGGGSATGVGTEETTSEATAPAPASPAPSNPDRPATPPAGSSF
ncbi:Hsp20/alpha crystallin family protein [Arthrobacter oryzae]|uniref:Hsp20/alpha crystallin family protein n=1 Tax=Arthrobacter oryzae TaxID=409290 RepID=UPI001C82B62D|nr:Hsp20/alpha crystallin family protein [Arthrobacter oryzae]